MIVKFHDGSATRKFKDCRTKAVNSYSHSSTQKPQAYAARKAQML
jgi:hypothetical protein